ncbi:3-hydroxy-3-methylglutaryl coenzyme A reductase 1 [Olea europaea subsp. europaea]|uniref:3-hydroxy-3-methylglutaryl coenzyme A reductase 1, partial n=1 Tax=Olea europaea subsp. europaea TaxID=158383 RepID=A0A8S0UUK1_OLEEU|nr:3-hydroxy-3-methylglutaryl coenzyme A reductase 1 [Olea europaea subsp. europaea]
MDVKQQSMIQESQKPSTKNHDSSSDVLPLPLYLANGVFFTIFFSAVYYLLLRWREKIRNSAPLHVLTLSEMSALVAFLVSFIYLLGFFGISFVQSLIIPRATHDILDELEEIDQLMNKEDSRAAPCAAAPTPSDCQVASPKPKSKLDRIDAADQLPAPALTLSEVDEEIIKSVVEGKTPSYSLESKLGDTLRAAAIRREALQRICGKSLAGLPLEGFDYDAILGQCCEMPVGYVQIPVGIAGPLLLDGREFSRT